MRWYGANSRVYWSLHAIVRNFVLDLVTFKVNVTLAAPCAFFFAQLKPFFKKGATGCHALDSTSASPLVLTQQRHYVQAHYQFTTYNDLCQFFIHALSTWRLPIYFKMGGIGSTILRFKVLNFAPSIFRIPQLLPTSEICSAFVAVWDIFCFYLARYPIMYRSNEFLNRVPRASIFKHSPEPRHSWRTFSQPHVVCTPPNSRCTYSTIFARLQNLQCRIPSSCYLFQATAPTRSHPHLVILLPPRLCTDAAAPGHQEDVMRKKPKDLLDGVTVRVSIEIWDSCSDLCHIVYMQKAATQQDAWARRSVRRGTAGKVASMQ